MERQYADGEIKDIAFYNMIENMKEMEHFVELINRKQSDLEKHNTIKKLLILYDDLKQKYPDLIPLIEKKYQHIPDNRMNRKWVLARKIAEIEIKMNHFQNSNFFTNW